MTKESRSTYFLVKVRSVNISTTTAAVAILVYTELEAALIDFYRSRQAVVVVIVIMMLCSSTSSNGHDSQLDPNSSVRGRVNIRVILCNNFQEGILKEKNTIAIVYF